VVTDRIFSGLANHKTTLRDLGAESGLSLNDMTGSYKRWSIIYIFTLNSIHDAVVLLLQLYLKCCRNATSAKRGVLEWMTPNRLCGFTLTTNYFKMV